MIVRLTISRVELDDVGIYTCETETVSGGVTMMTTSVSVLAPAQVSITGGGHTGEVTVKAASQLSLRCDGDGVPAPAVSWWRDGVMVTRSVVGGADLQLDNVMTSSSGEYICRGDNGVGDTASDAITVNVLAPPGVQMSSNLESCNLHISCHIKSSSPAILRWWYNGLILHKQKFSEVFITFL